MGGILFFPSCDPNAGYGHVTRCSALADEFASRGYETIFACGANYQQTLDYLKVLGQKILKLKTNNSLFDDKTLSKRLFQDNKFSWLVADDYEINDTWLKQARSISRNIAVIDDLADRRLDCDLLINQNPGFEGSYRGLLSKSTVKLIGLKYALLRRPFYESRTKGLRTRNQISRILVFMGGNDTGDNTLKAIQALNILGLVDLHIDIVISEGYQSRQRLENALSGALYQWRIYQNVSTSEMSTLTETADLAIGTAGSSSWERCCLGLPSILIVVAENQRRIAEKLDMLGAAMHISSSDEGLEVALIQSLYGLLNSAVNLREMSLKAASLVDGKGAERVSAAMLA